MDTCARCGHVLGVGRFCTNCGHPVGAPLSSDDDWRTGTAERPAVPQTPPPMNSPAVAPAPTSTPTEPRYPLFADEVPESPAQEPLPSTEPAVATGGHSAHRRRSQPWLPWLGVAVALVLVAVLGGWLLLSGDDAPSSAQATDPGASSAPPTTAPTSPESSAPSPSPSTSSTPSKKPPKAKRTDVARLAEATVPATAPPNQDTSGNLVRYEARNMLDGVPQTCWRMPGDGTGKEITIKLAEPTTLTKVGLINGYAKTATDARGQSLDWYHGDRRVLSVEWVFDDGSSVSQSFDDTRALQTIKVAKVTTQTVTIRLVSVSNPGKGRAARNYTPISDVAMVGSQA